MNMSFSFPSSFRENLLRAELDFDADTFKMMLMRAGFAFSSTNHSVKANVSGTTGAISYGIVASTKTFTRTAGGSTSFIDDGFVVGNYITCSGTNKGTYVVRAVTALTMRVDLVGAATIVDETAVAQTILCQDEMAAILSDTAGIGVSVVAATFTLTRASGSWITDGFVAGTVFTGSGTNAGPYRAVTVAALTMIVELVGSAAIVNENAVAQVYTNGYTRGGIAVTFGLDGNVLTLETLSFDWSDFGAAILSSPGVLVFDDSSAAPEPVDAIVAFGRTSAFTMSF